MGRWKEKFYLLLAPVCNKLPHYAVDRTIQAGYGGQYKSAVVTVYSSAPETTQPACAFQDVPRKGLLATRAASLGAARSQSVA